MKKWIIALICVGFMIFLLFGIFVWPTCYNYDRVEIGGNTYPVRTHRITGQTEMLIGARGWVKQHERE